MLGISNTWNLCGTLSYHDLEEDISFECLSYVWGTAETDCAFWLGTFMLPISVNLREALQSLQHATEPRMIWVDFICINQGDFAERKQQVELMYRLYSKADKVVAYLGEEADGSEHLPYFLCRIEDAFLNRGNEKWDEFINPWIETDWIRLNLPPVGDVFWITIQSFISRPWFVRVWIMQEALAAKDLFIICGGWTIPAALIFQCLRIVCTEHLPFMPKLSEYSFITTNPAVSGKTQLNLLMELGLCEILSGGDNSLSLIDILERSRHASCTDPRDRIFALLNISNDKESIGLQPDYTSTVSETYKLAAQALVVAGHGHRLLRNGWLSDSELDLPSWAPDWSLESVPYDTISPLATRWDKTGLFEAGGTENSIHLGENLDELIVEVLHIGNVCSLEDILKYQDNPLAALYHHLDQHPVHKFKIIRRGQVSLASDAGKTDVEPEAIAETLISDEITSVVEEKLLECSKHLIIFYMSESIFTYLDKSLSPVYKDKDFSEVVWRTMICDRELDSQRKAPWHYRTHFLSYLSRVLFAFGMVCVPEYEQAIWGRVLNEPLADQFQTSEQFLDMFVRVKNMQGEEAAEFVKAASKFCHSMRVIMTDTGVVGMVPRCTQKRDVVVVVKGVSVPLVLRREVDGRFKVVGQAYFWGLMNGEVFEWRIWRKRKLC